MAKLDIATLVIIGLFAFSAYMIYQSSQTGVDTEGLAPADLTTSITINALDALATTPTAVDAQYYIFKSDGTFYKEGETGSDGQDTVDVQWGGSYKLIIYNESNVWGSSGGGYIPEMTTFEANNEAGSIKTINVALNKVGGLEISDVRDPVDLNGNISYSAGSTQGWELLYKVNVSNAAIYHPVLVVDYNQTGIDSDGVKVATEGWTKITCPHRLTSASGRIKTCFEYNGIVTSAMGLQKISGSIKFDDTNSPGTGSVAEFKLIDTMMYREPDYKIAGEKAFLYGQEDTQDNDVGAGDSWSDVLGFAG